MSSAKLIEAERPSIQNRLTLPSKVILHAGMTKTGSTALQNLFTCRYVDLLKQGVLFPNSFLTRKDLTDIHRTSGHWDLIRQLQENDLGAFEVELEATENQSHTLILSSESIFQGASSEDLMRLAAFLSECSVTLVVSLRSQETWAQSRYYESVTKGFFRERRDYDEFLLSLAQDGKLDYLTHLRKLETFLQPEKVVVWNHDQLVSNEGFVAAFLKYFSIDLDPYIPRKKSNISKPTPEAIEAHRRLNTLAAGLAPGDYRVWCSEMRRTCDRMRKELSLKLSYQTPSKDTKQHVLDTVRISNLALSNAYFHGESFGPSATWLEEEKVSPQNEKVIYLYEMGARMLAKRIAHTARREQLVRRDIAREKEMRLSADRYEVALLKSRDFGISINETYKSVKTLVRRYELLLSHIDQLQTRNDLLINSRSWRLTAPYRAIGRWARRLFTGRRIDQLNALSNSASEVHKALSWTKGKSIESPRDAGTIVFRSNGTRTEHKVDICIATTCRWPGGNTSSTLDEIRTFEEAGLSVLVIHVPVTVSTKISARYTPFLDSIVHAQDIERVECRALITRAPRVIMSNEFLSLARKIKTKHAVFVINNSAYRTDGSPVFSWDDLKKRVSSFPWPRKDVHPLGPAIREEALRHHYTSLAGEDWAPTFDASTLPFVPRTALIPPFVIGRHGRDGAEKWLEDASLLQKAYPNNDRFQIRILGGAANAEALLGKLPSNWVVYPFGSLDVASYLAKLDAFVYFPNSQLNEAFGRTIMEAMLAGVPCILPPGFVRTFGDSAIYCKAEDVATVLERLASDDINRIRYVTAVRREALKRFESQALFRRLPELLEDEELPQLRKLSPSLTNYKKWIESGELSAFSTNSTKSKA